MLKSKKLVKLWPLVGPPYHFDKEFFQDAIQKSAIRLSLDKKKAHHRMALNKFLNWIRNALVFQILINLPSSVFIRRCPKKRSPLQLQLSLETSE